MLIMENYLISLVLLLVVMWGLWLVSLARRDASIADAFWGTGFAIVAWFSCVRSLPLSSRGLLVAVLTTIWAVRLSGHLLRRNLIHGEDRRYRAMREVHGSRFAWVSLFTVFFLQGLILWFVSWPLQATICQPHAAPLGWLDAAGTVVWTFGFLFETIGDRQLARFQRKPLNRGKVLDTGLWRYTRHPNYFGDFCVWWGLYAIGVAGGAAWTVASPLVMSYLLLRVSGVTLLERSIGERRPEYAAYQRRTNAFFPGPPRG